jgi:hypothetical protein
MITDEKIEYYRRETKACEGGLKCRGWSCLPIVELLATIDALRAAQRPEPLEIPPTESASGIRGYASGWNDALKAQGKL